MYPPNDNEYRVGRYKKYLETLNTKGIEMPMAVKDIDKFEKQNNYVINVYGCDQDGGNIFPRRISKRRDQKSINLLMLENGEHYHYVLIKNLNRLLGSREGHHTKVFCPYCCHGFKKIFA